MSPRASILFDLAVIVIALMLSACGAPRGPHAVSPEEAAANLQWFRERYFDQPLTDALNAHDKEVLP